MLTGKLVKDTRQLGYDAEEAKLTGDEESFFLAGQAWWGKGFCASVSRMPVSNPCCWWCAKPAVWRLAEGRVELVHDDFYDWPGAEQAGLLRGSTPVSFAQSSGLRRLGMPEAEYRIA